MKRSATIDTNNSLSLCRYYYTHNTGSSDDVLLNSSATHRTPSDYAAIHPSERYTSPEWIPPRPQIRRQETTRRFSDIENYNPDQNIEELRTEMSEKLQLPQSSLSPSPEDLCQTLLGSHETEEHTNAFPDIYLLLFGFLFFPLWWYGAWRFFVYPAKNRRITGFQLLNCLMSLFSLLLLGLLIGLVFSLVEKDRFFT